MRPTTTSGVGDYPLMAQALEPASQNAIELVVVSAHQRVLYLATGTGNAALLAAVRGGPPSTNQVVVAAGAGSGVGALNQPS